MMQSVEQYMKQAIADKFPSVSSAAETSSIHLMRQSPDIVRRWVNEVQEAVYHDSSSRSRSSRLNPSNR